MLGLNPADPSWPPLDKGKGKEDEAAGPKRVRPYPWQTVALAWLRVMEKSALRAGVLGDDMGLGKTIVALLHVLLIVDLDMAEHYTQKTPVIYTKGTPQLAAVNSVLSFKPTLILFPPNASEV